MTEQEVYKIIKPMIEGYTEGLFWDFKKTLSNSAEIIKDILAFSNSNYNGDSYIIVGVSESESQRNSRRLKLSSTDRKRLDTTDNFLYFPGKWELHGLNATDIGKMKVFSKELSEQIEASMLISQPQCEYVPLQIKKKHWLYVIVVKRVPGVFISKKDLYRKNNNSNPVVKQGVLYVRIADITIGNDLNKPTPAIEHVRVWKRYIDWLSDQNAISQSMMEGDGDDQTR